MIYMIADWMDFSSTGIGYLRLAAFIGIGVAIYVMANSFLMEFEAMAAVVYPLFLALFGGTTDWVLYGGFYCIYWIARYFYKHSSRRNGLLVGGIGCSLFFLVVLYSGLISSEMRL